MLNPPGKKSKIRHFINNILEVTSKIIIPPKIGHKSRHKIQTTPTHNKIMVNKIGIKRGSRIGKVTTKMNKITILTLLAVKTCTLLLMKLKMVKIVDQPTTILLPIGSTSMISIVVWQTHKICPERISNEFRDLWIRRTGRISTQAKFKNSLPKISGKKWRAHPVTTTHREINSRVIR